MADVTCAMEQPDAVLELRRAVLRPDRPAAESVYPTDNHPLTGHAVARDQTGAVVGVASVAVDAAPALIETDVEAAHQWRLRGMATAESVRGTGVGRQLLQLVTDHARRNGAQLIWCNARLAAVGFYERAGWVVVSDLFDLPHIGPHHIMCEALDALEHN